MFSESIRVLRAVMIVSALFYSSAVSAQIEVIDTSSYLPAYYRGAIDYNLMIASSSGYVSEVERLIKRGANINAATSEGVTPLIFAVANNHSEVVKALLEYEPDIDKFANDSRSALLVAVNNGNPEIAEMLIRAGADIDYTDRNGATALHYAAVYGDFYMTDMLLYYYARPDSRSLDGTTPLMAAILAEHAAVADLLIQNGANMEARDKDGFTPLMIATQNGDTLIMNLLIKKGVDLNATNRYNYDALALAIMANSVEAAELLLGNDIKQDRGTGTVNPYKVAGTFRRKEIINLLEKNNVSGKYYFGVDQVSISISSKFTGNDMFTGIGLALKEPYLNSGFIAGCDTKLWYSRVLIEDISNLYYQYLDKRTILYAGLFRDFSITDRQFGGNYYVTFSLLASGVVANKFKGTNISADARFRLIPAVTLQWSSRHIGVFMGAEYMGTEFYRIGPLWGRAGISYRFFINTERAPGKVIRWN